MNSATRVVMNLVVVAALGFVMLALFGWLDTPAEEAESHARKCNSARNFRLLEDADRYCASALTIVRREKDLPAVVAARTHTEVAMLALMRKRVDESVEHCQAALAAWRASGDFPPDRMESEQACESVLSTAAKHRKEQI